MSYFGIQNKEDLVKRALRQAGKAPEEYKKSVELYYITRYFVSVFEARNHELPLQVWNEYRNALDHFFRYITDSDFTPSSNATVLDNEKIKHDQLVKMDGHLTRAALDVIKLTCHASDENIAKLMAQFNIEALSFIDNGSFVKTIRSKVSTAQQTFLLAKTEDYDYGQDIRKNKQIISRYLDAAFAFEEIRQIIDTKIIDIDSATNKLKSISKAVENNTRKNSFIPNVSASLIASIIFSVLTALAGYYFGTQKSMDIPNTAQVSYKNKRGLKIRNPPLIINSPNK
jgi:hypothetical protein